MKNILIIPLLIFSFSSGESIGFIEKGVIDRFENAYALVSRGDQVIPVTKLGIEIQKADVVKTFRKSTLKIRLKDNTVINIGKKTTLKIENYIYSSQNKSENAANLKIENGSFKIETGEIGNQAPKNFKIKTKFSTIGLRG